MKQCKIQVTLPRHSLVTGTALLLGKKGGKTDLGKSALSPPPDRVFLFYVVLAGPELRDPPASSLYLPRAEIKKSVSLHARAPPHVWVCYVHMLQKVRCQTPGNLSSR